MTHRYKGIIRDDLEKIAVFGQEFGWVLHYGANTTVHVLRTRNRPENAKYVKLEALVSLYNLGAGSPWFRGLDVWQKRAVEEYTQDLHPSDKATVRRIRRPPGLGVFCLKTGHLR
ncbi:hypothetical protein VPHD260_0062 [Vibrio phage D260]